MYLYIRKYYVCIINFHSYSYTYPYANDLQGFKNAYIIIIIAWAKSIAILSRIR